jgi:hypothetical protein
MVKLNKYKFINAAIFVFLRMVCLVKLFAQGSQRLAKQHLNDEGTKVPFIGLQGGCPIAC